MSTKFMMALSAALVFVATTAGTSAAGARSDTIAHSNVAKFNQCDEAQGSFDRTCMSAACMPFDVVQGLRSVGPTVPMRCQQIAMIGR